MESENPVVGIYGSWGSPPYLELVNVGPDKYGVFLSKTDGGQGYHWSEKHLLIPLGKTVKEVWSITDEQDDSGAYDPTGVDGPSVAYRSSAGIRFVPVEDDGMEQHPYYDIEVISRGTSSSNKSGRVHSENWTGVYRFRDGKYHLLKRTEFTEAQKHRLPPAHGLK